MNNRRLYNIRNIINISSAVLLVMLSIIFFRNQVRHLPISVSLLIGWCSANLIITIFENKRLRKNIIDNVTSMQCNIDNKILDINEFRKKHQHLDK